VTRPTFDSAVRRSPADTQSARTLRAPDSGLLLGWATRDGYSAGVGFTGTHAAPCTADAPLLLEGEGHAITIAPTGAGKGVSCLVPALLRHRGAAIVVDPKGENYAMTARRRRELGQRVVLLDPMGVTDAPADAFDPLDAIDVGDAAAVDEAAALAHLLCTQATGDDPRNRFWSSRSVHLLTGVLLDVLQEARESGDGAQPRSLYAVRERVNSAAGDPLALATRLGASRHPEVRRIADLLRIGAADTLGGIVAFAQEAVDFLRGDRLETAVARTTFPLQAITEGAPLTVYIVLPPYMLESHGRLLRLWLGALFACIVRRRAAPLAPTLFLLDEAAQLGELPQLRQAVTLLRGYGLQTWSFWQDLSQLQRLYPHDWQTMVNNCRAVQCFGATGLGAADDVARLTGWHDVDAILALPADRQVLRIAGRRPVLARRADYRSDAAFAGLYDPNPLYDATRVGAAPRRRPQRLLPDARLGVDPGEAPAAAPRAASLPARDETLLPRLLGRWVS
jgi:type IV secretion system protein VirD4